MSLKTFIIVMVAALLLAAYLYIRSVTITVTGTIIEHNTTSDRNGRIQYYTVARFNDGRLRSIEGLDYYVKPVGSTITYTYETIK